MTKELWTTEKVERYLLERKKNGQKLVLPNEAYVTENFSWNEVLRTQYRNIDMPTVVRGIGLRLMAGMCLLVSLIC